ncbi:MAG: hypothetical protein LBB67_06350 [Oscillospiraceae bacterium]|jgi:DNA-directed RNA polymerase specialized sigma subunit|nr:hypothetical protein [Oscillospiraceae bacterium]
MSHHAGVGSCLSIDAQHTLDNLSYQIWQRENVEEDVFSHAGDAAAMRLLQELRKTVLNETERQALRLCLENRIPSTLAAAQLGLSPSQVLRAKQRALRKLRDSMIPVRQFFVLLQKEVSLRQLI